MSSFDASYSLPAPRRITTSNLPLPSQHANDSSIEPGVEVKVDNLKVDPLFDGSLRRAVIGTSTHFPIKNDGHGDLPLDEVPGIGIIMPGGLNAYYLDIAPNTDGALHRTTSTDFVIVITGKLSVVAPKPDAFQVKDGKPTCDVVETVAGPGDVVYQRGAVHALSNRTDEWVRILAVVLASENNKVDVGESGTHKELSDQWFA
ncbi:hypothetical protein V494_08400 [Pseudogymnoascus sp. VKM F-4513 (FW-928)]|nr:hypothetical protein V494_08400 [Pseudogymnoascus sp. VKM F-4513 (FW-928)]